MTIDITVRVTHGRFEGKTGVIRAICDNHEYLIDFAFSKERLQGYWIKGFFLEQEVTTRRGSN